MQRSGTRPLCLLFIALTGLAQKQASSSPAPLTTNDAEQRNNGDDHHTQHQSSKASRSQPEARQGSVSPPTTNNGAQKAQGEHHNMEHHSQSHSPARRRSSRRRLSVGSKCSRNGSLRCAEGLVCTCPSQRRKLASKVSNKVMNVGRRLFGAPSKSQDSCRCTHAPPSPPARPPPQRPPPTHPPPHSPPSIHHNCRATTDPHIWACITDYPRNHPGYSSFTNTNTDGLHCQACVEKGLTSAWAQNSQTPLFTNEIVESLYQSASGNTCVAGTGQSGSCGWYEIASPPVSTHCPTPQDCTSSINWLPCKHTTYSSSTSADAQSHIYGLCNAPS